MKIIAITGPTGSGKSTVASSLAINMNKSVNIDADLIKHMIVSGFIYDETAQGILQWKLLGDNIGLLAKNFFGAGYNVIINGYINQPAWDKIANHIDFTHKFLLLPELETNKYRDEQRHENIVMGSQAVSDHYQYFSGDEYYKDFVKIDTTNQTIDETVSEILSYM